MNRKERRASAALARARRHRDPKSSAAQRVVEEIQAAQAVAQRYGSQAELAQKALQVASQLKAIPKPEGWTEGDGEPDFERLDLIEQGEEKLREAQVNFANALLDVYDLFNKFDEPVSDIVVVGANALPKQA